MQVWIDVDGLRSGQLQGEVHRPAPHENPAARARCELNRYNRNGSQQQGEGS
ncbi:hypothetical protein KR52_08520 [Synechococcus sp. KORDI-52]|nr:hypothetical protein KR52_08520 [Synechococcus sp. KORDI-52]